MLALVFSLSACSGTQPGGDSQTADRNPPILEITAPLRGAMSDGTILIVTGRAFDYETSVTQVTVNGHLAELEIDGTFTFELSGTDGIIFLETVAVDEAGNQQFDTRAVLIGNLVEQDTPVADGVVARIGADTYEVLGRMVSELASITDFEALALSLNPVVNTGNGCNSAKIYVETLSLGDVPVSATAVAGGIDAAVSVKDVEVTGRVTFRLLCIGGSASFTITADSYNLTGLVRPTIVNSDISLRLDNVTSAFSGFDLDVGGIPGFVENLFEGKVRDFLADLLGDRVGELLPDRASEFLSDLLADSYTISALGHSINVSVKPTAMTWDESGGLIIIETNASVDGVFGAHYLSTPMAPPIADMGAPGLQVGLADDVPNQLLAAMWAAGSFEIGYDTRENDPVRTFFPRADRVEIYFSLPPVATAATIGILDIAVGDVIVEILDDDEGLGTLAKIAISAQLHLAAALGADGRIHLQTAQSRILTQILEQSDQLFIPLDSAKAAAFADLAIKRFARNADDLLAGLPIPSLVGATLTNPTIEPRGGYVVVGASLD